MPRQHVPTQAPSALKRRARRRKVAGLESVSAVGVSLVTCPCSPCGAGGYSTGSDSRPFSPGTAPRSCRAPLAGLGKAAAVVVEILDLEFLAHRSYSRKKSMSDGKPSPCSMKLGRSVDPPSADQGLAPPCACALVGGKQVKWSKSTGRKRAPDHRESSIWRALARIWVMYCLSSPSRAASTARLSVRPTPGRMSGMAFSGQIR